MSYSISSIENNPLLIYMTAV